MYITFERFATMGAELSTLTVEKNKNPNITNRFFVKIDKETSVVVYTNPANETYSNPSSSFCFTKGDDLMFCLNALKHAGFHPYKSNGIGAGFSFIGEENTFPKMPAMKATLGQREETCYWNPYTKTLNIPNKCLTFEEIENLFNEIKRDNTVQPVFTKSEEDFPVIPNSRTSSPTLVKEENSADVPVDAVVNAPADAVVDAPGDAVVDASANAPDPVVIQNPLVYQQGISCTVNGYKGQFIQGPHGQFVMTNELGPIPATMCVMINGTLIPINFNN